MNVLMLFMPVFLLISDLSLCFAKEDNKNNSRPLPVPSKIQYSGEDGDQSENNSIYGSSGGFNPYDGFPNSYGGFIIPQEILRTRSPGRDSSSEDQNPGNGYQNEQSSGGSGYLYPTSRDGSGYLYPTSRDGSGYLYPTSRDGSSYLYPTSRDGSGYLYPASRDGSAVPNGVFSNPFLGQRRRTFSTPSYGGTDGGNEQSYGGGSYPGGSYTPAYRPQTGIYQTPSVFRPGAGQGFIYPTDQGYVYPLLGAGGIGVGLRQPNYPYGYGTGNGYGVYPGTFRNIPTMYLPSSGGNDISGESPRGGYGPALFGYGRNPELGFPGVGFDYGRLNESNPRGNQPNGNVAPQGAGLPYPQSTQSSESSNGTSEQKAKWVRKEDP